MEKCELTGDNLIGGLDEACAPLRNNPLFKGALLISLLAVVSISVFSGVTYYSEQKTDHREMAEREATYLAEFLKTEAWDILFEESSQGEWKFREFDETSLRLLDLQGQKHGDAFPLVKIKIYDLSTQIVYSTDKTIIGKLNNDNSYLADALEGISSSKWVHKDSFLDLDDEERFVVEIVEAYVPIFDSMGKIAGVYELYMDVTRHHDRFVASMTAYLVKLTGLLVSVFSIICVIVYCAERRIARSQRLLFEEGIELRQANIKLEFQIRERLKAEERLEQYKDHLEEKVKQRTIELDTVNKALQQEKQELEQSEEYLKVILDSIRAAVVVIDPQTHEMLDANVFASEMMGREHDEIVGSRCFDTFCPTKEGCCPVTDLNQEVTCREGMLRIPNGQKIHILKSVVPIIRKDKQYLIESFIDITEIKETENRLKRANAELKEADRLKSEFVMTVSHELRTPLTIFKGILSNAMANAFGRIRPKLRSMLELADENIDRLSGIISNFFNIFEVDAGRVELEKTPVGIDLIVGEAVEKYNVEAAKKNVEITMSQCAEGFYVDVDQARICQAIGNIIENAIRFVPEGGRIEVRICDAGDELRVEIEDNGPGIKQDDIEKVFNRFIQIDKEVGPGDRGTGLGLPIAKKLIGLHGGRIWVESTIGAGSNFCFTLPKCQIGRQGNRVILPDEPEPILHV